MKIWVDAQPRLWPPWMREALQVEAYALRDLGLRDAKDSLIFERARTENAIVFTKDQDFLDLLRRRGPPPRILWLSSGNSSNQHVRTLLVRSWPKVLGLFESGEALVELRDRP